VLEERKSRLCKCFDKGGESLETDWLSFVCLFWSGNFHRANEIHAARYEPTFILLFTAPSSKLGSILIWQGITDSFPMTIEALFISPERSWSFHRFPIFASRFKSSAYLSNLFLDHFLKFACCTVVAS
jgi:hypothetical protein